MSALTATVAAKACSCGRAITGLHLAECPQFERFESKPRDFVGIADGTLVYIGIADRAKFDALDLPCTDHGETVNGHLLSKAIHRTADSKVTVIFQHWITQITVMAMIADRNAERVAKEAQQP